MSGQTKMTDERPVSSSSSLHSLVPTRTDELPLSELAGFASLSALHRLWATTGAPPRNLDPLDLPPAIFPYVMVFDLDWEKRHARIRLAGDFIRQRHGRRVVGAAPEDFFAEADAPQVTQALFDVAERRVPSFAFRRYVCAFQRTWSYHRLLLPLVDAQGQVDRIFKTIEPAKLREHSDLDDCSSNAKSRAPVAKGRR